MNRFYIPKFKLGDWVATEKEYQGQPLFGSISDLRWDNRENEFQYRFTGMEKPWISERLLVLS